MDVWGLARVSGQSRERYFLLLVDAYTRSGEFSSDLLRDFCRGEGILHSFTLPDFPQQNGIVERRIGLVTEVARTSMIHAPAPHFLWPFARHFFPSHDVMFDESVPFYRLFPYRSAPPPPPPLFFAPGPPRVDPLPPEGPAPSGVSQVDSLPGSAPVRVAVGSGAALSQKAERVREVRSCASHQVHEATHKLWVRTTRLYGLV
ncbi:unnamed protein product [Closterium sp. NIES-54]